VFRFQLENFYVWLMRHVSWNEFTNSLLDIQFPFMLINSALLRHDQRSHSRRARTLRCTATWARSEQFEW
jgi:hypothetical protein